MKTIIDGIEIFLNCTKSDYNDFLKVAKIEKFEHGYTITLDYDKIENDSVLCFEFIEYDILEQLSERGFKND